MEAQKQHATRKIRLQMIRGKESLGSFVKDEGPQQITIGSSKTADIVIPGKKISGIHAMLRVTAENDCVLYDLGSKSGTYVTGKRVVQSSLEQGTSFRVGDQCFKLDFIDDQNPEDAPEQKLFWDAKLRSNDILDIAVIKNGELQQTYQLSSGRTLKTGIEDDQIYIEGISNREAFVARKRIDGHEGAYCFLPHGFKAEIYDAANNLVGNVEKSNEYFAIGPNQKARMFCGEDEVHVYWRTQQARFERGTPDADSKRIKESVGASLGLSIIVVAIMYLMPQKEKELELSEKKSSYYRVTSQARPAPAPAPAPEIETVDQVVAKAQPKVQRQPKQPVKKPVTVAKVVKPQGPSKKTLAVTSALSNLLSKTSKKKVEVSNRGRKVIQAGIVPVSGGSASSLKTEVTGQTAEAVNTASLSNSLAKGRVQGLKGFKGGTGSGSLFGKGAPSMDVGLGDSDAQTTGGLDKAVIARVVRSHLGQIKHCYERQLLVDPNLFGKVVARWVIDPNGRVDMSSVKKSTMGNRNVENCVVSKIKGWKFPKPKGGGKVIVSYPFLFKSVN